MNLAMPMNLCIFTYSVCVCVVTSDGLVDDLVAPGNRLRRVPGHSEAIVPLLRHPQVLSRKKCH